DCSITAPGTVCPDSEGNKASVPDAGTGASYSWTISNGEITGGSGTREITWTAGSSGTVEISVTVTNAYSCSCSSSKAVEIKYVPGCLHPGGQYKISGTKYNDRNGNGIRDKGEPGLPGWTITIVSDGGDRLSTTTGADGSYTFENLFPITYTVSEVLRPGWKRTAPAEDPVVTLSDENPSWTVDFGNWLDPSVLVVTKEADQTSVIAGSVVTFTITVENTGDAVIEGVTLVDTLSPGLIYSDADPQPSDVSGNIITWDLEYLEPRASTSITLWAIVDPSLCPGQFVPVQAVPEGELSVMAATSESPDLTRIVEGLSRNRTKLEEKLKVIRRYRDSFDRAGAALISRTFVMAGENYTLNTYTNLSSGENLTETRNSTGFLLSSEYERPVKQDMLRTEYGPGGEVVYEFYNFLPTSESLTIEYDRPQAGYRTYTVRYYATGDTLIVIVDRFGNVVRREYRKTPGMPEIGVLDNCAQASGYIDGVFISSNRGCVRIEWGCQGPEPSLGLMITKEPDRSYVSKPGDKIRYAYYVTNTGTVEIDTLTIEDDMLGLVLNGEAVTIGPGDTVGPY
ncbi:MAG: SdrD B-like domain-containing protein, partial [Methanothrix sp.]|nr:SdrD B-like domain-containing protein [Methanothrix sp.]